MTASGKLSRVVVEGRAVRLCRAHAAVVASAMPRTFDELRALFREQPSESSPWGRRSKLERRASDDRRAFPPRPEGRRMTGGRRASDEAA
jgi:hypothetical protein